MRKYALLILHFIPLNTWVLLQATELANLMLNAEEDKMFYAVVSANEICLFLELLKVWLLWQKALNGPEVVDHTKRIIVSDKYWNTLL